MRGVIALAAALSVPEHLADGSPFPQRNLIIFLTFSVILVTLGPARPDIACVDTRAWAVRPNGAEL